MEPLDEDIQATAAQPGGPSVNPAEILLHSVGRFPLMICAFTLIGTVGSLVFGFSQPNTYTSVGMLLVRMGAREMQTPESAVDPNLQVRAVSGLATGDELLMLLNPALAERVVEKVGVEAILQPYDPTAQDGESTPQHIRWLHEFQAWLMGSGMPLENDGGAPSKAMTAAAVKRVAAGTAIDAQRRTNTIVVSFTAHDGELAQRVATAYLGVLQARHREVYETSDKVSFVSERLDEANEAAEAARAALRAQREKDGIHNFQDHQGALALEIQNLEAQARQDAILIESLSRQLFAIDSQLADTSPEISLFPLDEESTENPEENSTAVSNEQGEGNEEPERAADAIPYTLNTLLAQLQGANAELIALGNVYAVTAPYYQEESQRLLERIRTIEGQIRLLRTSSANGADPVLVLQQQDAQLARQLNPVYTTLLTQRFTITQQREALDAALTAREAVLTANRTELARLVPLEPTYTRLQRVVAETEQRAAQLERAHSQSATLQLIDSDERMGNLIVTQEPFLPTQKNGPDRLKFLLMGVFGGLAAGLALAIARQLLDSRLRYPADAEGALGIRVLGVVPEQRQWRRVGRKLQQATARRT